MIDSAIDPTSVPTDRRETPKPTQQVETPKVEKPKSDPSKPRMSTVRETVTVRQKFALSLYQEPYKEAEEAINEYHTGKKAVLFKDKKSKAHEAALTMLWKTFHSTLTMEIDCRTGKKTVYKDKKRPNIFEIEISEVHTEPLKEEE